MLRPSGVLITPDAVPTDQLPNKKTLNVALLGALSAHLPMAEEQWLAALRAGVCGDVLRREPEGVPDRTPWPEGRGQEVPDPERTV